MGYVDVHNHICFGVDDGSDSFETSCSMLRIAAEEGITDIILTPHFLTEDRSAGYEHIESVMEQLREYIEQEHLGIRLYHGNEIRYSHDALALLDEGKAACMSGDKKRVLLEFSPQDDYGYITSGVNDFVNAGYIPILAHVERYEEVFDKKGRVEELRELGAEIQINAQSVLGWPSKMYKKRVAKLLKDELVDYVGTDAHSTRTRAPRIKECAEVLAKKFGKIYAEDLLYYNAKKRLINQMRYEL